MQYIIETKKVTKQYGRNVVVDQVSLRVRKGEIYGLIGKNGAGKTTLMRLILGLTTAQSGEVKLFDGEDLNQARRKIGSLVEIPALYLRETAYENMLRFGMLCDAKEEDIQRLLGLVGLQDVGNKTAGNFSLGMKQRLGIAIALLSSPEVLILDEPVNGLDPAGIKEIRDLILELNAKGVTFLISSHLLDELGKIATTFGIMANGKLVEELTAADLAQRCRTALEVQTDNGLKAYDILKKWRPHLEINVTDNRVQILTEPDDVSEVTITLANAGIRIYEIKHVSASPEEFFIERMG